MKLYTIGFTKKTAQQFFGLIKANQIRVLVDIRLRPDGQLAGFAKRSDLPYFLANLAGGCEYVHMPEFAPTDEILDAYRQSKDWKSFEADVSKLLEERQISDDFYATMLKKGPYCLLCSEALPDHCHRRLVAEHLRAKWQEIEIVHL